ncbi:MAG TPA: tRNA (adenosine(37)-N6)-threonylcarbamoyltransferase complex transferase subunit TsaD [Bacteroidales bacterium]|nr:tRNA (adenosine(37)-N6)-threonylcarbamoyltransferase complex transferase subunit TsaD [Bacteroidales bacterium]
MSITILGIESSCDDTAAAIIEDGFILSSKIASQEVHKQYGGVVPELASRAHMQNIIPVVEMALKDAFKTQNDISAVAFTRGPGLLGSLLVGASFAKGFALARNIPLIDVNHLQAHVLAHFIQRKEGTKILPEFPFLCLLISGGHTQLIIVNDYLDMKIIGQTIDDAAGEAFDKCAKVMGLPYPGGPMIDEYAKLGNPLAFQFSKPRIKNLDFSFSGLKTSFLYFLRDRLQENSSFIKDHQYDICASIQKAIIDILVEKLVKASLETGIREVAVAGGVAANSDLRIRLSREGLQRKWRIFFPEFHYSTDNAAMIAITGYYKFLNSEFAPLDISPSARFNI